MLKVQGRETRKQKGLKQKDLKSKIETIQLNKEK